jgi:hypothetical protein
MDLAATYQSRRKIYARLLAQEVRLPKYLLFRRLKPQHSALVMLWLDFLHLSARPALK